MNRSISDQRIIHPPLTSSQSSIRNPKEARIGILGKLQRVASFRTSNGSLTTSSSFSTTSFQKPRQSSYENGRSGMLKRVKSVLVQSRPQTKKFERNAKNVRRTLSAKQISAASRSSSNSNNVSSLEGDFNQKIDENPNMTRSMSKKEKYFAEKQDKNYFMKLIHPSYHERNQQFRKLFVEKGMIDENDVYLASYSCAYQREILAQGRIFLTQSNICFYANIIGWETNLVIPLKDVKLISKQKAALIFPNSIQFEKFNGEKHFFASFVARDKSFHVLTLTLDRFKKGNKVTPEEIWEILNNNADEMKNGSTTTPSSIDSQQTTNLNSPTGFSSSSSSEMTAPNTRQSMKSKRASVEKDNCSQSSSVTSSDNIAHDDSNFPEEGGGEEDVECDDDDTQNKSINLTSSLVLDDDDFSDSATSVDVSFEQIKCPCDEHQGRLVLDAVFPISLKRMYGLLFSQNPWFDRFNKELKNKGYVASPWTRDKSGDESRTCTYSVALNHAMAPKNVIVNEKQTISFFERRHDGFRVYKETQNSGVPYADNFMVQCTNCFCRVGVNATRIMVHGGIYYKKGVWSIIKGYIEKGTHQGLDDHYRLLEKMLMEECQRINQEESESSQISRSVPINASSTIDQSIIEKPTRKSQTFIKAKRLTAGGENSSISSPTPASNGKPAGATTTAIDSCINTTASSNWNSEFLSYKPILIGILVVLSIFLLTNFLILIDMWKMQKSKRIEPLKDSEQLSLVDTISILTLQVQKLQNQLEKLQNHRTEL